MENNQILLLIGVSPSIRGSRWQTEQRLRIGRHPGLEIVVNEPSMSRQHAEIRVTPQGWIVQDLGSSAGTLLNGVSIGKLSRKLQQQDLLQCGQLMFKVEELQWQPLRSADVVPQNLQTSGKVMQLQAFSHLSWEQGLNELAEEDVCLPHAKQFLTLLRAGYHLSRIDSVHELLQTLLDDVVGVLNARRGAILLLNETSGELALRTSAGFKSSSTGRTYSNTLAQRCFSKGESLLCLDHRAEAVPADSRVNNDMTSVICALLRSPRRRLGVLHLDRGPAQEPFSEGDFKLADAIAATVSVGIESAVGVEKQRGQFLQEVMELAQGVMAKHDPALVEHGKRVCAVSLLLGDKLRLSSVEKQQLRLGALLHDFGKIGIPSLQEEEQMRSHPQAGAALAEKISSFAAAVPIIRSHHEAWDGSGYPDGLKKEAIPRLARIVAVADAWDYLTTETPGKQALSMGDALQQLKEDSGRKYDPVIVHALLSLGLHLGEHAK